MIPALQMIPLIGTFNALTVATQARTEAGSASSHATGVVSPFIEAQAACAFSKVRAAAITWAPRSVKHAQGFKPEAGIAAGEQIRLVVEGKTRRDVLRGRTITKTGRAFWLDHGQQRHGDVLVQVPAAQPMCDLGLEHCGPHPRHHHSRHFWIEPANAVASNDKVRRIEHRALTKSSTARSTFGRSGSIRSNRVHRPTGVHI